MIRYGKMSSKCLSLPENVVVCSYLSPGHPDVFLAMKNCIFSPCKSLSMLMGKTVEESQQKCCQCYLIWPWYLILQIKLTSFLQSSLQKEFSSTSLQNMDFGICGFFLVTSAQIVLVNFTIRRLILMKILKVTNWLKT